MNDKPQNRALGTLFGVGVGPGDPGLLTIRAVEVLKEVSVIAYPVKKEGAVSRALETVREHLPAGTELLPLTMPMTRDKDKLDEAHLEAVEALRRAAAGGRQIAYLSLGDPLFFSTFGYIAERYGGPVKVISGVTAMSALSAEIGLPIADTDTATVVVTGKAHEDLQKALQMEASIIILKPNSLDEDSLALLDQQGAFERASAAIELGRSDKEIITELSLEQARELPYFSIIWVRSPERGEPGA